MILSHYCIQNNVGMNVEFWRMNKKYLCAKEKSKFGVLEAFFGKNVETFIT